MVSSVVDANAEDGSTSGWRVFDATPAGASVSVVADDAMGSQVYELSGSGRSNGYQLGGLDTLIAVHGMQFRGDFLVDDIGMLTIVNAAPLAVLSVDQNEGNSPLVSSFDAGASRDDNDVVRYAFDFGDGSEIVSGAESVVSHSYSAVGEYTAVVTVSDAAGNQASASVVITVNPEVVVDNLPVAAFSINSPITGSTVTFVDESTDDNKVISLLWNFGNATETGQSSESIAKVQELGSEGWIDEQFSLQGSPHLDFVQAHSSGSRQEPRHEVWWRDVVDGEDQLRQRVAFALSQIFVVSVCMK